MADTVEVEPIVSLDAAEDAAGDAAADAAGEEAPEAGVLGAGVEAEFEQAAMTMATVAVRTRRLADLGIGMGSVRVR